MTAPPAAVAVTPSGAPPVAFEGLSRRFGQMTAVDAVTAVLAPGRVTGFLGPNGAGKTNTLRMLLGLLEPTSGRATIFGRPYRELGRPGRLVGAVFERPGFHPARSGRDHLRIMAAANGVSAKRVDRVLRVVGLAGAADRRAGAYSQGMRQRLAIATALLGEPPLLILDEPANGLDPDGMRWLRKLVRARA